MYSIIFTQKPLPEGFKERTFSELKDVKKKLPTLDEEFLLALQNLAEDRNFKKIVKGVNNKNDSTINRLVNKSMKTFNLERAYRPCLFDLIKYGAVWIGSLKTKITLEESLEDVFIRISRPISKGYLIKYIENNWNIIAEKVKNRTKGNLRKISEISRRDKSIFWLREDMGMKFTHIASALSPDKDHLLTEDQVKKAYHRTKKRFQNQLPSVKR